MAVSPYRPLAIGFFPPVNYGRYAAESILIFSDNHTAACRIVCVHKRVKQCLAHGLVQRCVINTEKSFQAERAWEIECKLI